jgi:pimeloyl-ACP methyl ester carboxylesterase
VLRVLRGALFVYAVYAAALFALQRKLLFPAWAVPARPAPERPHLERWALPVDGGEVEAWLLPADVSPAPALVFFHGNGESADDWLAPLELFRARGFHVLVPEYRGYTRSAGAPSREALVADADAFVQRLARDPRVDPQRIFFLGRSLGGAVAAEVAARRRPAALVLQSTFTSVAALAAQRGLPALLVRDPFDTLQRVPELGLPVLVAHGQRDDLIPFAHGQALARAAGRPLIALDCRHNDCPPDWAAWVDAVIRFAGEAAEAKSRPLRAVGPR